MRFLQLKNASGEVIERAVPEVAPRPVLKSVKLEKQHSALMHDSLAEYAEIAEAIGFMPPNLAVESFKMFLVEHDLPVFSLPEVIKYMDIKAAKEGIPEAGWMWRPLREKDHRRMGFGQQGHGGQWNGNMTAVIGKVPASDWYNGPARVVQTWWGGDQGGFQQQMQQMQQSRTHEFQRPADQTHYDKTVPLHALRKVALIEREFKGDVAFFVCDYAPALAAAFPDPFLLAVIPNIYVSSGTGRFVIDFWDEPGFGIESQIK